MRSSKKSMLLLLAGMLVVLSACSEKQSPTAEATPAQTGAAQTAAAPTEAGPFAKSAKPIKIKIGKDVDASDKSLPAGDSPENNPYTRYIKDNLNIDTKIVWQAASGKDYDQKVNLSIASNDLPDALVVKDTQFRQMVKAVNSRI
jgi:putative aldouronate transport system substrate-binding protein